jgi:ubiquinone/menaquinone biosynthesis C-methylase UbiE
MRQDWNARARTNAMHYIASEQQVWDAAAFFASGEQAVAEYADSFLRAQAFDPAAARMLEIGCGIGRMTRAFARRFGQVDALDISDVMIAQGRELLGDYPNITWRTGTGSDLAGYADNTFDFVFSYIVFQHVPRAEIVLNYVREIGRVLRPGGVFKFQTRTLLREPSGLWEVRTRLGVHAWRLLAQAIPRPRARTRGDLAEGQDELKAGHYKSWAGNALPLPRLRAALVAAGLDYTIARPGTQYTWVSGRKRSAG